MLSKLLEVSSKIRPNLILLLCMTTMLTAKAQYGRSEPTLKKKQNLEILHADSTIIILANDRNYRELFGNVVMKHKEVIMRCQYAKQDVLANTVEATGKIRISQGDSITVTGEKLNYDANTRLAYVSGGTVLKDRKMTLRTEKIDYHIKDGWVVYDQPGTIQDEKNTLTSQTGKYNTKTKMFYFKNEVKIKAPTYELTTDSLNYNSREKIAFFLTKTLIKSEDGEAIAQAGTYNTVTKKSDFKGRSIFDSEDYSIEADTLDFDGGSESGVAKGNVILIRKPKTKQEKVVIKGQVGIRNKAEGWVRVYGNAFLEDHREADTLFIKADTLHSYENPADSTDRKLTAINHVMVFMNDLAAISDSLIYNQKDSLIHFYKKPILWNADNQLEADSISIIQKKSDVVKLFGSAFVISVDSILNYNQIKGRRIECVFDSTSALDFVKVEGNGESNYFAVDEQQKTVGMNHVQCGKMTLRFAKNQVKKITFVGDPDSQFYPPKYITEKASKLEGFEWKIKKKPTRTQFNL